ncbi:MAG: hypothetical protein Q8L37_06260 [Candidatus Gottesmanbacteria bacterium]|nr:hypothetical protein [Candidatus Gottesmanbacteria bacterium]
MIDTILVIGNGGSGKSIMVWYISSLLTENGYTIHYISDRLGLEKGVVKDVQNAPKQSDGSRVGKHSKLIADGPPGHKKVHVLDGSILNNVHDDMIARIDRKKQKKIFLIEYATGPEISFGGKKEPLHQTADSLVGLIKKYRVRDRVFLIEIQVPVNIRQQRQSHRPDAMAAETFHSYFNDGGIMTTKYQKYLGNHYFRLVNVEEDNDGYYSEVRHLYETRIQPRLTSITASLGI